MQPPIVQTMPRNGALSTPSEATACPAPPTAPTDASAPDPSFGTSSQCVPGQLHMPRASRRSEQKYFLFEAAHQGCLHCVKHFLEVALCWQSVPRVRVGKGKGRGVDRNGISSRVVRVHGYSARCQVENVDPKSFSQNSGYTVRDWAQWAVEQNVAGALQVLDYLDSELPTSAAPGSSCVPGVSHPPPVRRTGQLKYWLFAAAAKGCRQCVARYLEVEQVDPMSESENMHYTVLDWALQAKRQGETGADDLLDYLYTTWPTIPAVSLGFPSGSKLHLLRPRLLSPPRSRTVLGSWRGPRGERAGPGIAAPAGSEA